MTVNLGSITLIAGVPNTFTTPSSGLAGILVGNESGFTCGVQVGSRSPRNLLPGSVDFFPIDPFYHGVIIINPVGSLSTAGLFPSSLMYFEAVGFDEGFNPAGYPMSLPRNTTGSFAGVQSSYNIFTFTLPQLNGTNVIPLPPVAANTTITPLTLYGNFNFEANPATAARLVLQTGGGAETNSVVTPGSSTIGWIELTGPSGTSTVNANIPAQSGKGFGPTTLLFGASGFTAGNWSASIALAYGVAITASMTLRLSVYDIASGTYTTVGTIPIVGQSLGVARSVFTFPSTAMPQILLPSGTNLYVDLFAKGTVAWNVADTVSVFQAPGATPQGLVNDVQINTPGMITPVSGSITNGNTLYTAQMATYIGGIDIDVIQAIQSTQVITRLLNLDPVRIQVNSARQFGWTYAVAAAGNLNMREHYFQNPIKGADGQQVEVTIFQNTGTEIISGQIYYYVQ